MVIRQDYFTFLSHTKQVDGTEEEVLHREPPHHLQAKRGFLTSSPNGSNLLRYSSGIPTNKKSVTHSLNMAAAYITFECSFISLDIRITSTHKSKIYRPAPNLLSC